MTTSASIPTHLFSPHLYYNCPTSSSPCTVFMLSQDEWSVLFMCLEWFLFGKMIYILCDLTCTFANKVQLFHDLGIYSGIFAIYLHFALTRREESRMTNIVFYALCLLYILSTATVLSDLLVYVIEVSDHSIAKNIIFLIIYADSCQYTTGSTYRGLSANDNSRYDRRSYSKRLL